MTCKKYYKKNITFRLGLEQKKEVIGKIHEYDKSLLPNLKPEKAAKILSQLPSSTPSANQPQMVANISIRRGVEKGQVQIHYLNQKYFHNDLRFKGQHYLIKIYKLLVLKE